jgi:hypothetical protein
MYRTFLLNCIRVIRTELNLDPELNPDLNPDPKLTGPDPNLQIISDPPAFEF